MILGRWAGAFDGDILEKIATLRRLDIARFMKDSEPPRLAEAFLAHLLPPVERGEAILADLRHEY